MSASTGNAVLNKSFQLTDGASSAHRLVKPSTGTTKMKRKCTIATADTDRVFGVLITKTTTAYDEGTVTLYGVAKLEVNGSSTNIAAGDYIVATTGGVGVKSSTAGKKAIGIALEPATADGDLIDVLIIPGCVIPS